MGYNSEAAGVLLYTIRREATLEMELVRQSELRHTHIHTVTHSRKHEMIGSIT